MDNIRDTNFGDAIANIYDKMVMKIFINTIAKLHGKRWTDVVNRLKGWLRDWLTALAFEAGGLGFNSCADHIRRIDTNNLDTCRQCLVNAAATGVDNRR